MHYFWFIPVVVLVLLGVWVLYLAVARRAPEHPERSVEGAQEVEREEDAAAAAKNDKAV